MMSTIPQVSSVRGEAPHIIKTLQHHPELLAPAAVGELKCHFSNAQIAELGLEPETVKRAVQHRLHPRVADAAGVRAHRRLIARIARHSPRAACSVTSRYLRATSIPLAAPSTKPRIELLPNCRNAPPISGSMASMMRSPTERSR